MALGGVEAAQSEAVKHTPGTSLLSDNILLLVLLFLLLLLLLLLLVVAGVAEEQLQGPQVAGHLGDGEGGGGGQGAQQQGQEYHRLPRLHLL